MIQTFQSAISSKHAAQAVTFERQSPILRRLLRHLAEACRLGIGSRLLTVGVAGDAWQQSLEYLGIDSVVTDRASLPRMDDCQPFDLAIRHGIASGADSLVSLEALTSTASLLEHLRPGGYLTFLDEVQVDQANPPIDHTLQCLERHWQCFPVIQRDVAFIGDRSRIWSSHRLTHAPKGGALRVVTLTLPAVPASANYWKRLAVQAALATGMPCCSACQTTAAGTPFRQKAA